MKCMPQSTLQLRKPLTGDKFIAISNECSIPVCHSDVAFLLLKEFTYISFALLCEKLKFIFMLSIHCYDSV
jgi:hypothetical protein